MAEAPHVEKSVTPELWETPEGWQRLKPLFYPAMEKPPGERARFVDEVCDGDKALRDALLRLIQANEESIGQGNGPLVDLHGLFSGAKPTFQEGELVWNQFRIVRLIGSGGMGEVYEAIDLNLGRIALKAIRPEIALDPHVIAHFKKEVQLARRLSGPHVCRIHALHVASDATAGPRRIFLTMEYLDGITLTDKVRESGPLPWREVKAIALEICEGLRVMHEAGIIHRDLKSRNVMLADRNGSMKAVVMDFGLAREVRTATSETATDVSVEGVAGTIDYMAPEQFAGDPLTPAADIFALGVVMYELATGRHPFPSGTILQAAIRRGQRPAPPSSIQKGLPHRCDEIIGRCLEFDPKKRYGSVKEVEEALRAGPANVTNIRSDHPWAFRVACALILAALGWGAFQLWQWWRYDRPSADASRWYDQGVTALREGSYVKATRLLTAAIGSDSHFAMAHARLAEAWANLDFDGRSTQELVNALSGEHHLRPLDSLYLTAIHATLMRDYAGAVLLYQRILNRLPDDKTQRAAGYVDLGMAYERAGDPTHAHESFVKSETLDSDNPSGYMQEAILDTRLHKVDEANRAFDKAEAIFAREMNQEGRAELDYERGYEANQEGKAEQANEFLNRSLSEAEQIQDVQLQIRTLTQLSSVAYNSDQDEKAVDYAEHAIRLARANQLNVWAANGLVRLANARIDQGAVHYQQADEALQEALQLAQQSQQRRVEAIANLTLASLRDQQHRPTEVMGPAQKALDYYKQNGYFEPAAKAWLLLIRTQQDQGHFREALQGGNSFLDMSARSGNRELVMYAEEIVGTIYLRMENYPLALDHFKKAEAAADSTSDQYYQMLHCAETLWKLGRFSESDALLQSIPQSDTFALQTTQVRISSLLAQQRYAQARAASDLMMTSRPSMSVEDKQEFQRYRTIAEVHLGMKSQAAADLQILLSEDHQINNPADQAETNLAIAEIFLIADKPAAARDRALSAETYFSSNQLHDSELHTASLAAIASKAMGDHAGYRAWSAKAFDIYSDLQHTWDPQAYQVYISRPDIRLLIKQLPRGNSSD
jgi:hypothetical protein